MQPVQSAHEYDEILVLNILASKGVHLYQSILDAGLLFWARVDHVLVISLTHIYPYNDTIRYQSELNLGE